MPLPSRSPMPRTDQPASMPLATTQDCVIAPLLTPQTDNSWLELTQRMPPAPPLKNFPAPTIADAASGPVVSVARELGVNPSICQTTGLPECARQTMSCLPSALKSAADPVAAHASCATKTTQD